MLNGGEPIDLARSLFVGDAAGREGDFSSSDRDFAANVGAERGGTLAFRTPEATPPFKTPSAEERRRETYAPSEPARREIESLAKSLRL